MILNIRKQFLSFSRVLLTVLVSQVSGLISLQIQQAFLLLVFLELTFKVVLKMLLQEQLANLMLFSHTTSHVKDS